MAPPQNAEVENVVKFRLLVPQGRQYISMKVNFGDEEAPKIQELVKFVFLVHGQVSIIFVVGLSVGLSVCLFVHSFSQPSLIRF